MTRPSLDEALIAASLKRSPLFFSLPAPIVVELTRMSRIRRYSHGELLYQTGDAVQGLYIVVTGTLENSLLQARGRRFVLGYVPPGDSIGLVPALDGKSALSDVRAHEDSVVVLIPGNHLRALLERQPALLFRFTTELCQNIRRFGVHIERLAMLRLRQRFAHAILSLAGSYGHSTAEGIDIELKVSQNDLAAMLSVSRQRVNAELRTLVAEGIVSARYSHITILDSVRLAARASSR